MYAIEVNNLKKYYPKKIPFPFRKVEWIEAVKGISDIGALSFLHFNHLNKV